MAFSSQKKLIIDNFPLFENTGGIMVLLSVKYVFLEKTPHRIY